MQPKISCLFSNTNSSHDLQDSMVDNFHVSYSTSSHAASSDSSFENITKLENEIDVDDTPPVCPIRTRKKPMATKKPKFSSDPVPIFENNSGPSNAIGMNIDADDIIVNSHDMLMESSATSYSSVAERRFLALIVYQNSVGAAFYDTENCVLNVFKEISETEDFTNCIKICHQCSPEKIIVNAKQKSSLVDLLNTHYFPEGESGVEVVSTSLFVYDIARQRLENISLGSQLPPDSTFHHRSVWASSVLDFSDKNSIKAAGALLRYIDQNRIGIELEDSCIQAPILALAQVHILSTLYLDNDTFFALQIFQDESHPSKVKRGLNSAEKEGLSLFGQINHTKSRLGALKLKHWFKTPSRDVNIIIQRQEAINFFSLHENLEKVMAINSCLKNVKNQTKIIAKMTSSSISVPEWSTLYKTLYNLICLLDLCNTLGQDIEAIELIQKADFSSLKEILAMINKIVDFEESKVKNRFVVKHGIDKDLDEKKRVFNGLPELMTNVAEQELAQLDSRILECNVIYLPQLGYLLEIPHYPFISDQNGYILGDLEFKFINNNTLYYKSMHTRELDRMLGDTQSEICDHESGIMHRLQNTILQYVDILLKALDFSAELDCIISISTFAKDNNLVFPHITNDKVINIRGGRHLLYEMCSSQFVTNDVDFNREEGYMKVISGPNACGKSVYLKQVALIVYMAHLGAPVSATYAEICLCDSLFTRIKCVESVSINLSTFVLDLNQITKAVNGATDKSLVVIDEFGKGTSYQDGIALFTEVLKHWLAKKQECPFVIAATHYHSIFRLKLLPPSPFLKFKTFDIATDQKGVVYLFKLIDGYCLHSRANHVAKLAGIDDQVLKRAEEILELASQQKPISSLWKCDQAHVNIVDRFLTSNLEDKDSFDRFLEFAKSKAP